MKIANDSKTAGVVKALRAGLGAARSEGRSLVAAEHLAPDQLQTLIAATLEHLRSRPGKPSTIDGWSQVSARDAAVMRWWSEVAGLTERERRRLAPLRKEVYDDLAERRLIVKGEGGSTSIHVSPAVAAPEVAATAAPAIIEGDPAGAWVLKLSPYVYDVNRVFFAPDRRVRVWSVEDHERSVAMRNGDAVYLWMGEGDSLRAPGVWGVGHVTGQAAPGVADDGWLSPEAAGRASVFALVDIALLDVPVSREVFLADARLAGAEVISDPIAPNPCVLTGSEAAALAEYLPAVGVLSDPRVA